MISPVLLHTSVMFLLRFIFNSVVMWVVTRVFGRLLPILARLVRILLP